MRKPRAASPSQNGSGQAISCIPRPMMSRITGASVGPISSYSMVMPLALICSHFLALLQAAPAPKKVRFVAPTTGSHPVDRTHQNRGAARVRGWSAQPPFPELSPMGSSVRAEASRRPKPPHPTPEPKSGNDRDQRDTTYVAAAFCRSQSGMAFDETRARGAWDELSTCCSRRRSPGSRPCDRMTARSSDTRRSRRNQRGCRSGASESAASWRRRTSRWL